MVILEEISTDCDSSAMGLLFLRGDGGNNACIRDDAVGGNILFVDEENGVGALYSSGHALCKSSNFIAHGMEPCMACGRKWCNELFVVLLAASGWIKDIVEELELIMCGSAGGSCMGWSTEWYTAIWF